MYSNDKVKQRVRKLLNQAADREGTPEGEAFYEKAFALMAQYGLAASQVDDSPDAQVGYSVIEFSGTYTDMQARLATALAKVLHCECFVNSKRRSTRVSRITIFGAEHNRDRAEMLFRMLNLSMATGAARISGSGAIRRKRSFMLGFIQAVAEKLREAEQSIQEENRGYGVLVVDYKNQASEALNAYLEKHGMRLSSRPAHNTIDAHAYNSGADSGRNSDLGQQRIHHRRALAG